MKKVIGIFMTMVMMFLVISMNIGYATEVADITGSEGYELVREFAETNGLDDWYIENDVNGVLYGCGAFDIECWEREYGLTYSFENFEKWMNEYWELCECRIRKCGEINGYDVYLIEAQSETKELGHKWNDDTEMYDPYYCARVLFMICEN